MHIWNAKVGLVRMHVEGMITMPVLWHASSRLLLKRGWFNLDMISSIPCCCHFLIYFI